jgi:murein DD-endopeptidase MepM/ murein hydrolase activator NlpD
VAAWGPLRRLPTAALVLGLTAHAAGAAGAPAPRWPLDLPPVLTSSFGEYRASHLHAGIDLGTGGRTGVPCYAVEDGWVARMRMSPFGYGKAVYLQLDSGQLVVYAHLSRFAALLAARARAEQRRLGRYTFDLQLGPQELRVRRGEVVAWSGQTGVGVPHLHFEVRDGDVALNPQLHGFAVADALAPSIESVLLLPRDAASQVDGELRERELGREPVPPRSRKQAAPPPPAPRVSGRIGFAVRAHDRAGAGEHRQGPYRYELRLDGRTLYSATQERFDYADNHLHVLDYDQRRLVEHGERFFQLFLRPGNRLPGRQADERTLGLLQTPRPGLADFLHDPFGTEPVAVPPGRHEVEIVVADAAGNRAVKRFPIVVSHPPSLQLEARPGAGSVHVTCTAQDPDADGGGAAEDSLDVQLEASRDLGLGWMPLAGTTTQPTAAGLTVSADLGWDGGTPLALRARVRDASGLEAVCTWTSGAAAESDLELPVTLQPQWGSSWLCIDLEPAGLLAEPPRLFAVQPGGDRRLLPVQQQDTRRYGVAVAFDKLVPGLEAVELQARALDGRRAALRRPLVARIVRRGQPARVRDLHPRVEIDIPAGALLEDIALRLEPLRADDLGLGPELVVAGPVVQVEPRGAAFERGFRVVAQPGLEDTTPVADGAAPGAAAARLGLFYQNRAGDLRFLSAERTPEGALVGETRFLSRFAVLADSTPPHIGALRVLRGGRLRCRVYDRGADLDSNGIQAELDGALAIPEWDPETGEVWIEPEARLARGAHALRIVATDQLGNRAERLLPFTIP